LTKELIYVDRIVLKVFASDGLTYVPLPFTPKPEDLSVAVTDGQCESLEAYQLSSIWKTK